MSVTDRLYRRVQMAFATLKVTSTDDSGPVHRVGALIPTTGERLDNVPVLQIHGLASHAAVNADAMAVFIGGDRSNPVIVATGDQAMRLRGLKSGEVALYDGRGNVVKLADDGTIQITCPNKVRIVCPRLEVTGDVVANCDGAAISLVTHRHRDTQPGGGNSGVPIP